MNINRSERLRRGLDMLAVRLGLRQDVQNS